MKPISILLFIVIASCQTGKQRSVKTGMVFAPANTKRVKLPVKVLPTEAGEEERDAVNAFKYPPEMSLYGLDNIEDVAAYGAASQLWLGPKGWTGKGLAATNGGVRVDIYPEGGEKLTGPHICYSQEPSCLGCILSSAAKYFPKARAAYNAQFGDDNSEPIDTSGLEISWVSPTVVTYVRRMQNGFITKGLAYYLDAPDKYFAEATFVLPADNAGLINVLQKQFISTLPH